MERRHGGLECGLWEGGQLLDQYAKRGVGAIPRRVKNVCTSVWVGKCKMSTNRVVAEMRIGGHAGPMAWEVPAMQYQVEEGSHSGCWIWTGICEH